MVRGKGGHVVVLGLPMNRIAARRALHPHVAPRRSNCFPAVFQETPCRKDEPSTRWSSSPSARRRPLPVRPSRAKDGQHVTRPALLHRFPPQGYASSAPCPRICEHAYESSSGVISSMLQTSSTMRGSLSRSSVPKKTRTQFGRSNCLDPTPTPIFLHAQGWKRSEFICETNEQRRPRRRAKLALHASSVQRGSFKQTNRRRCGNEHDAMFALGEARTHVYRGDHHARRGYPVQRKTRDSHVRHRVQSPHLVVVHIADGASMGPSPPHGR